MDWNENGTIDASDILITELFEGELEQNKKLKKQQNNNDFDEDVSKGSQ